MNNALIIGATGGIGQALSHSLDGQGVAVRGLSRSADGFDLTDPDGVDRALRALEGPFDLILVASGALEIAGTAPERVCARSRHLR